MELSQIAVLAENSEPLPQLTYQYDVRQVKVDFQVGRWADVYFEDCWIYDIPLRGSMTDLIHWVQHLQGKRWINANLLVQVYLHWRFDNP